MNETIALPTRNATKRGIVIELPDGTNVPLATDVSVGTSSLCDLVLEDRTVSRRHVLLSPSAHGVRVQDQESRNGTFFGDARVSDVEVPLGAEVRLGATTLRFSEADVETPDVEVVERLGRFVGSAPKLQPMYARLKKAIASDTTVLIEGESGSGKELLSEAVHQLSARSDGPFVVVDCGSMPENLIESELFGHEKGAFTGAEESRAGAFERAHGGTVFLDEIGELPLGLQTRLLRFLDRRQVRRVGASETRTVDVRVVAATNRNLELEVERGHFRLDLFHRIAVVYVQVPPLRERPGDLTRLAKHMVLMLGGDVSALTPEHLERIRQRRWPGNVRELRNHIERWIILGEAEASTHPDVEPARANLPFRQARAKAVADFTQIYVETMLARHNGNVSRAAEAAGVARRYFQRLKATP